MRVCRLPRALDLIESGTLRLPLLEPVQQARVDPHRMRVWPKFGSISVVRDLASPVVERMLCDKYVPKALRRLTYTGCDSDHPQKPRSKFQDRLGGKDR